MATHHLIAARIGPILNGLGLVALGVVPLSALAVDTDVFASATHRQTQVQITDQAFNQPGDLSQVQANVAAPSLSVFGPSSAQAYSNVSGTFWVHATAGTIDPYSTNAILQWESTQIKTSPGQRAVARITGATMAVIDYGSTFDEWLLAYLSFSVKLDDATIYSFESLISGHNGPAGDINFRHETQSDIPGIQGLESYSTIASSSGRVHEAYYNLQPFELAIDLGAIPVGQTYRLTYVAQADAQNIGGESKALAYFRDPLETSGGITVTIEDVSPVPEPATLWMFGFGAGLLGSVLLRRRGAGGPRQWQP